MTDAPVAPADATPATPAPAELTAASAQEQIAALSNNSEWATKLLAGDPGARLEFDRLSAVIAGVTIDSAKATSPDDDQPFFTTTGQELSPRNLRAAIVDLAESGMLPKSIDEIVAGTYQVPPDQYQFAEQSFRERTTNQEYVARYLAGGAVEKREMTILNAILMNGPKVK